MNQTTVTPLWQKNTAPASVRSCCSSLGDLPFSRLRTDEVVLADLDSDSPAFDFPQGLSRFVAYRLDSQASVCLISMTTYGVGDLVNSIAFFPALTFLDQARRPIGTIEPDLKFELGTQAIVAPAWSGRVRCPAEAEYVVVHNPKDKLGVFLRSGLDEQERERALFLAGPLLARKINSASQVVGAGRIAIAQIREATGQ